MKVRVLIYNLGIKPSSIYPPQRGVCGTSFRMMFKRDLGTIDFIPHVHLGIESSVPFVLEEGDQVFLIPED